MQAADGSLAPTQPSDAVSEARASESDERSSSVHARSDSHLPFLDGVRGLAATYVVLHHAILNLPESDNAIEGVLRELLSFGHYAVDIFIVLSGYCLMLPILRKHEPMPFRRFIVRRALRIIPTYYLAMAMSLALIATWIGKSEHTHWDVSIPVSFRDVALHAALLQDWFSNSTFKINHPHWSVAVEWKIYFLFPLLLLLRTRIGVARMTMLALGLGYATWFVLSRLGVGNTSPWGSSPYYVGLFALGMLAAELTETRLWRSSMSVARTRLLFGLASAAVVAVTMVRLPGGRHISLQWTSAVVGTWAASTLVALRMAVLPVVNTIVTARPAVALGKIGYSLYLVHAPIVQMVYLYVVRGSGVSAAMRAPLMLVASAIASCLVSVSFYYFAERPFHALSRRA